ncbi:MAG: ROK family protein [Fimbriimonadaceae bacterium]|nr:ROK family protein [Fimbriimonadaceae bacterium]QYK59086.1 MAG: ROK family protein [Fimbriimonadaceae bacterium]
MASLPYAGPLWGIDLGGTKIEGCAAVQGPDGLAALARLRVPTQAERGYEAIVDRVSEVVARLEQATGSTRPRLIGVGSPGARRPDGTMKNCNTTSLNGRRLDEDLSSALGTEVVLANDADCFALAEARHGAGRGSRTVFGVIMGTGVGGGLVVEGRLLTGPNGLAGEWGHTTLVPNGEPCYCGRAGCVERYISGPAVEARYEAETSERLSLAEIASRAESDMKCASIVRQFCEGFGRALASVVNVLDPDVIVLGGGAGQTPQLLTWGLQDLQANIFGPDFVTPLVRPELGDSAGVFGAALLTVGH